jgi:uncharacterized protein (TIGR02145 family)
MNRNIARFRPVFIIMCLISFLSCKEDKEPLVVTITSPSESTNIEHFTTVPIILESNSDYVVEYYIDDSLQHISFVPTSVYKWLTTNVGTGKHSIKVIVREEDGRTATDQTEVNVVPSEKFETGSVTDVEGNVYNTVKIGGQWWMAENLKTTKYNDGEPIRTEKSNLFWSTLEEGGYCWYNSDFENENIMQYGALYNWYAVVSDKLCPAGWHVPTLQEVQQLITYLGEMDGAGEKIKAPCVWERNNMNGNGTNVSGFSALPGGMRADDLEYGFGSKYARAIWWVYEKGSSYDFHTTWEVESKSHNIIIYKYSSGTGCSVRCVKD